MQGDNTGSAALVVRLDAATKLELADRARENDRSLSAETRRTLREYLERGENEEEARTHE